MPPYLCWICLPLPWTVQSTVYSLWWTFSVNTIQCTVKAGQKLDYLYSEPYSRNLELGFKKNLNMTPSKFFHWWLNKHQSSRQTKIKYDHKWNLIAIQTMRNNNLISEYENRRSQCPLQIIFILYLNWFTQYHTGDTTCNLKIKWSLSLNSSKFQYKKGKDYRTLEAK